MVRKINPALLKPMKLSADLEAVVGKGPMPRSQVVKKLWMYIKKNISMKFLGERQDLILYRHKYYR